MKKIAAYIIIGVGLTLFGLNHFDVGNTDNVCTRPNQKLESKSVITNIENEDDSSFDLSKVNLPSIFSALINLI